MHRSSPRLTTFFLLSFLAQPLAAQPPAAPSSPPRAIAPAQSAARNPFNVSSGDQAWLDQVLDKWEADSAEVHNFYSDFERDVHNGFGPGGGQPTRKEKGKLGYTRPDKGSFQITESLVWESKPQATSPSAGQPAEGDWVKEAGDMPGEHWVCNGKQVYQYRNTEKQLVVTPIPPDMQGNAIVDGPLPFLFGAEAEKLKARYWIRPAKELSNTTLLGLHVKPKFQKDAANYSDVWVVLRNEQRKPLMPAGIRIRLPDGSWEEYRFKLTEAQVNARLPQIFGTLFQTPRTPWGWKKVVEPMQGPPVQAQRPPANRAR